MEENRRSSPETVAKGRKKPSNELLLGEEGHRPVAGTSMSRKATRLFMLAALVSAAFVSWGSLGAQSRFVCTGDGCAFLPLSASTLDRMLKEFQTQYTNTLFDDMAEAAVVAGLSGPPIGSVNLAGFTLGANFSLGVVKPHDVTVNIPGLAEMKDVPSAGGAVSPRVFVGANLGQIIGLDYDPFTRKSSPSFISPSRFDVYASFMDVKDTYQTQGTTGGKVDGSAYFKGVEVRYHLVEGTELGGFLLRFLGVSVGVGAFNTRQAIFFELNEQTMKMTVEGVDLVWEPKASVDWQTKIDTYPVEVRTGLQILYVLRLTAGAGVAMSKGGTDFLISQSGPVYAKSDLAQSLGYDLPTAALHMDIMGNGRVPARLAYGKLGVELNLWALQIGVEATATKRSYGANIGIRVEL